jgi:hypothetical protein
MMVNMALQRDRLSGCGQACKVAGRQGAKLDTFFTILVTGGLYCE